MFVRLACGTDTVPVDVPDNWINGRNYRAKPIEPCLDVRAELMAVLSTLPTGLSTLADGKRHCVIAVDPSHPQVIGELLPALIEMIEDETSLQKDQLTILVANTLDHPYRNADLRKLMDDGTRKSYRVVLHNPLAPEAATSLGPSSRGIPMTVNKVYLQADLRIILGAVAPDLLLGFSGGRSVLSPGLSSIDTLRLLYHPSVVGYPTVRYGNFRDNPIHVHAMETVQKAGCDLCISAVMCPEGAVSRLFAGHFGQSHFQAMTAIREAMTVTVKEPMDIVVTSGGGAPRDNTLHSIVPALAAVAPVLKPDGTIVIAGDLGGGLGPDYFAQAMRAADSLDELVRILSRDDHKLVPCQWTAQILHSILKSHEVILFSKTMAEEDVWKLGLTPARDMNDAILGAMESHGQRCKIAALPDGPDCLGSVLAPAATPAGKA
jgi:nickel-dependent lactate racemase